MGKTGLNVVFIGRKVGVRERREGKIGKDTEKEGK